MFFLFCALDFIYDLFNHFNITRGVNSWHLHNICRMLEIYDYIIYAVICLTVYIGTHNS